MRRLDRNDRVVSDASVCNSFVLAWVLNVGHVEHAPGRPSREMSRRASRANAVEDQVCVVGASALQRPDDYLYANMRK